MHHPQLLLFVVPGKQICNMVERTPKAVHTKVERIPHTLGGLILSEWEFTPP